MYRQINSPLEMGRRLAFLVYVIIFFTYIVSCVIALAHRGVAELAGVGTAFVLLIAIRYAGYRWLDFDRLCQSFPAGCSKDCVPEQIRSEVESLIYEFHANGTNWTRRLAIRRRLVQLEEDEPEVAEAYEEELKDVLAA